MKGAQGNDRPLPVYDIPADQLPEWDAFDDRVRCIDCRRRVVFTCSATRRSTHPLNLRHRCDSFKPFARRS